MYIEPSHRRRGIARALTEGVARFAVERGAERVTLRTFAQNEGALAVWTELGFEARILQLTASPERLLGVLGR